METITTGKDDGYKIFDQIKEYSNSFQHPDYIARLYSAIMKIERIMIDHIVEWRENG